MNRDDAPFMFDGHDFQIEGFKALLMAEGQPATLPVPSSTTTVSECRFSSNGMICSAVSG
ncbi:hypothetical protein [Paenibacillus glycinis]|uniref:Uncharacterized protein n=1 Tax=Paenibacillus glycinis TaxID=2697035 RepID=A0ABW9XIA7_9BACL|nr:hypothetical protein [Paenibacillus glycinis]NBD22345.1 hypothetical protein [Paenibacillus glycinis]